MRRYKKTLLVLPTIVAVAVGVWAATRRTPQPVVGRDGKITPEVLRQVMTKITPLQKKLERPGPSDWLANHRESGQTFKQYLSGMRRTIPTKARRTIYIQPLGDFTKGKRDVIDLTAKGVGVYFNLPVKTLKTLPLSVIPDKARRKHPTWGDKQILTTYVLDDLLKPRVLKDAFAFIALTSSDLWPGEGWNFVFGQASLYDRVGVWSIYRYGDPDKGAEARRLCLRRALCVAQQTFAMHSGHNDSGWRSVSARWLLPHMLHCHAVQW